MEEVVVDPVREALHVEEPPPQVRQDARRDVDVVLDEVDLLQPALGEEDLVRVRDVDLGAPHLQPHGSSIENHPSGACLDAATFWTMRSPAPPISRQNHAAPAPRIAAQTHSRWAL